MQALAHIVDFKPENLSVDMVGVLRDYLYSPVPLTHFFDPSVSTHYLAIVCTADYDSDLELLQLRVSKALGRFVSVVDAENADEAVYVTLLIITLAQTVACVCSSVLRPHHRAFPGDSKLRLPYMYRLTGPGGPIADELVHDKYTPPSSILFVAVKLADADSSEPFVIDLSGAISEVLGPLTNDQRENGPKWRGQVAIEVRAVSHTELTSSERWVP